MTRGNPSLVRAIRAEIETAGDLITFARFMDLALYHPDHGYYTAGPNRIGRAGDYFTSVSVGSLFGRILARQFLRFRADLGDPADFEVIEFGGQGGLLREDVLAAAPGLAYRVVEAGDPMMADPVVGCVFSNEFLDALPVHRVQVQDGKWREIYVTSEFTEQLGPLSEPRLAARLRGLPLDLMEGYRTEINLRALDWLEQVAARLERGYVLTFDYGHERERYFAPEHREGTLLCYHRHTRHDDPYRHIGEQDLTAHVEFSSLMEEGARLGLETLRFTDQAHYLVEIGEPVIREIVERDAGRPSKERQAIHQLIHPELMGRVFRVLLQEKEVTGRRRIS